MYRILTDKKISSQLARTLLIVTGLFYSIQAESTRIGYRSYLQFDYNLSKIDKRQVSPSQKQASFSPVQNAKNNIIFLTEKEMNKRLIFDKGPVGQLQKVKAISRIAQGVDSDEAGFERAQRRHQKPDSTAFADRGLRLMLTKGSILASANIDNYTPKDLRNFDASMPVIDSPIARLQLEEWLERIVSAKAEHPSVRAARLNEQENLSIIDEVKSILTPQVQLGLNYNVQRNLRNGERIPAVLGLPVTDRANLNVNLEISQLVFDGGAAFARIDAAKSRSDAAASRRESTEAAISLRAADNLIELAKLQEQLDVANENFSEVSRIRDMISERVRLGRDSPSEMLQMNTRFYEARNQVVLLLGLREEAGARHEETFGEPPVVLAFPEVFAPIPISIESAMEVAMSRNPDIVNARKLVAAAIAENRAAKADGLPRIEVQARLNSYDTFAEGSKFYDTFAGINVSHELFDGGREKAIANRTLVAIERVREQNNETMRNVEFSLKQAYANRQSLIPRYKSLQAQLDQQKKTRQAYEEQFLSGRRPLNDLIIAQQQVLSAALNTIESKSQLHRQHFLIMALMGDLVNLN